jgi:hypothetical protein
MNLYEKFKTFSLFFFVFMSIINIINNDITNAILLCYLFMLYIIIDIIWINIDKKYYRIDLMIHHIVCLIIFITLSDIIPIDGNYCLIGECISMINHMNFKKKTLMKYRLLCIFLVRIPIWIYMIYTHSHFYIEITLFSYKYGPFFFIFYDFYILKKIKQYFNKNN